jgi:hypothetical protein
VRPDPLVELPTLQRAGHGSDGPQRQAGRIRFGAEAAEEVPFRHPLDENLGGVQPSGLDQRDDHECSVAQPGQRIVHRIAGPGLLADGAHQHLTHLCVQRGLELRVAAVDTHARSDGNGL